MEKTKENLTKKDMLKKILITAILAILSLSGCTNGKWNQQDPNMPEEYKQQQREILQENLDILESDPQNIDSLVEVGFRYQMLGDYKNADKYYKKVLEIDDKHYPALNNLADIYEQMEDYETSATYIKRLYENNQNSPEVIRDTVRILLEAGEPNNAQSALENFARLKKGDNEYAQMISDLFESILSYKEEHKTN